MQNNIIMKNHYLFLMIYMIKPVQDLLNMKIYMK